MYALNSRGQCHAFMPQCHHLLLLAYSFFIYIYFYILWWIKILLPLSTEAPSKYVNYRLIYLSSLDEISYDILLSFTYLLCLIDFMHMNRLAMQRGFRAEMITLLLAMPHFPRYLLIYGFKMSDMALIIASAFAPAKWIYGRCIARCAFTPPSELHFYQESEAWFKARKPLDTIYCRPAADDFADSASRQRHLAHTAELHA